MQQKRLIQRRKLLSELIYIDVDQLELFFQECLS